MDADTDLQHAVKEHDKDMARLDRNNELRKQALIATAGFIRADREQRESETSEREQIARMVERMYGPHDRRFKAAIEIADAIRKG